MKKSLYDYFSIDVRSLYLARLFFSIILIWDFFERLPDIEAHYTDTGIFHRILTEFPGEPAWLHWSLLSVSGDVSYAYVFFALYLALLIYVALGNWSKITIAVLYVFLTSLHNRNLYILHGGDDIARLFVFWNLFLPPPRDGRYYGVATAALFLQVIFVYTFTVALKTGAAWGREGTALFYALSLEPFTKDLGVWLTRYHGFLAFCTKATTILERLAFLLAFSPVKRVEVRTVAIVLFFGFHIVVIGSLMNVGLISLESAAMWVSFLPGEIWNRFRLLKRLGDWLLQTRYGQDNQIQSGVTWRYERLINAACAIFLISVFLWNVQGVSNRLMLPYPVRAAIVFFRIDQKWDMFAQMPSTANGWYVFPAKLVNGEVIDLISGSSYTTKKPDRVWMQYANTRWLKYLTQLHANTNADKRQFYVHYTVRKWNESHNLSERVKSVQLIYFFQPTQPPDRPPLDPTPLLLFTWNYPN